MRHGLIINLEFHQANKWVSALTSHLVDEFIRKFEPTIITSQESYDNEKNSLDSILMMEPGWAAPFIKLDTGQRHITAMTLSDPHSKSEWFERYFFDNKIDYVLSYFKSPFFYHFPDFPVDHFVHFPWAIPDEFISERPLGINDTEISIFGGKNSDAYDVRNWCRKQRGITNHEFSGTENKQFSDIEYFKWLSTLGAAIAAGSSKPIYDLVTPKYFEIAASGPLLFAQSCKDLPELGFNESNCIIFTKKTFKRLVSRYKKNPEEFLDTRLEARKLIKERHSLSYRLNSLKELLESEKK